MRLDYNSQHITTTSTHWHSVHSDSTEWLAICLPWKVRTSPQLQQLLLCGAGREDSTDCTITAIFCLPFASLLSSVCLADLQGEAARHTYIGLQWISPVDIHEWVTS